MRCQNYQLGYSILKADENMILWQTENGRIEIGKNTLAVQIKLGDEHKGYIYHGNGKLLLDTIVETHEGAIGKPIERKLSEPFLMLGDTEKIRQYFNTASKEDLKMMGYENEQDFISKARDLCDQFFGRQKLHSCYHFDEENGFVFAFPNDPGKLDFLVAKDAKLVYRSKDGIFMSNMDKVVLKTPEEVIISNHKSFVIKK